MTNNNKYVKQICINIIKSQFRRRGVIGSDKKIHGTEEKFDVICLKKGGFSSKKSYIIFEYFEKVGDTEVAYFKSKVQIVAYKNEIEMAFMCLSIKKEAEPLSSETINCLNDIKDIPIAIFPC